MFFSRVNNQGFTFIEVLLVIGILGLIVGLAIPFYQTFQVASQLDNTTQEVVQTLRRAQTKAMASELFLPHGVHFESQRFVLFRGDSYDPSDLFNEIISVPSSVSISNNVGPDVIFSNILGEAAYLGSITISTGNKESRIIINEMGIIDVI